MRQKPLCDKVFAVDVTPSSIVEIFFVAEAQKPGGLRLCNMVVSD
jgi:hypothetical protein